ncbi:MAG: PPC domain-containing protein [Proteobacteria bacterium]|nr:PPC domain-containing protein [Pseudomonadota bacterium]
MRGKLWIGVASAALMALGFAPAVLAQDRDPPGDASTQAQLVAGTPIDGQISPAGDSDWYRLHVERGQSYHITLDGVAGGDAAQAIDTTLTVHGADGQQLAFNDDANGSLNSALDYVPSATGDVFVEAKSFSDTATGPYHLSVTATVLPPDEVGNDASTHARISAGSPVNGSLDYAGDVDWYRFSAHTGQMYTITLAGTQGAASPLADPMLRVVDSHGTEIASNDDSQGSLNSSLNFIPSRGGDVFVSAQGYGDQGTGAYTLNIAATALPPDDASADTGTRGRVNVGASVSGALDYPGDHDWYRVRLEQGQSYRFSLNGGDDHGLADPVLHLRDSHGEELATDDDSGEGLNSYLEFTAPNSGTYFLDVQSFDQSAFGRYTLSAAAGDIPNDATTDAVLSADGDSREGTIAPAGDQDWFKINLANGQGVRIAVNAAEGEGALQDPLIVMHGPDGAELARDDDGGQGLNSWMEFVAPAAGAYYLEVRGFSDDAQGRYSISVSAGDIGNTADGAESIEPNGDGRTAMINNDGDIDWFAVTLVEGRPYRFNVQGAEPGPLADPVLTLYDTDGHEVASDDDGGSGVNSYLSYTSVAGGQYYAAVSSFNNTGQGHYTLTVSDTDVPGNTNTDETLDAAAGDDRANRIEIAGDLDDYRVDLEAGAHYLIEVTAVGDDPLGDPYLTVLNSDGERVAADDDGGHGRNARLRFTPPQAGSYFLQASGLGGSTGSYKISIVRQ